MGPLSRIFSFFTLYVHSVSHTVPQNLATSVYQSPISTSFTRETSVLCLYFPLLTMVQKFSSFQSLSCVQLFATLWITACRALCPSATPGVHPTQVHWVGDAIQPSYLCRPLLCLPSIFPSIRVFSNESALRIRWPKYCSFSFNISPSNEYSGLISFRMDWLDLLAVQGTLKSLLQHHTSKASIPWLSAFFTVQLSHPYMTTGKTIALTRWNFVGKVTSLLFNRLSMLC